MLRLKHYVLDGHEIKEEPGLLQWARWFKTADRHVAINKINNIKISTVFLGLDHSWLPLSQKNKPVLFETMVFGGKLNGDMNRYCTWEEAEAGHKKMVKRVKKSLERESK
jgi:hypothetical protein